MKKKFLFCSLLAVLSVSLKAQVIDPAKPVTKADVMIFNKTEPEYIKLRKELAELEKQKTMLVSMMQEFDKKQKTVAGRMQTLEIKYDSLIGPAAGGGSQDQLLSATKAMQETQMSFNLQYLQLQSQMQHENRSYTAISNIMKTKHDTVKNSISNVR
ncbi:MAG TPA: hypothetical protein VGO58_16465 [Chitinophagaceae bacterium]|jgi:hypothetical protein|nr:hypothetical protein [Chitinophagaceae bacterium]